MMILDQDPRSDERVTKEYDMPAVKAHAGSHQMHKEDLAFSAAASLARSKDGRGAR
jgi:hypothetical protein